jgi:hypothetical protein
VSKQASFDQYRDDFLIFCSSRQKNKSSLEPVGVFWVADEHFADIPDAWRVEAVQMLERRGFGWSVNTGSDQEFTINGEGMTEAARLLRKNGLFGRLSNQLSSSWISNLIAIGALVVSIAALIRG